MVQKRSGVEFWLRFVAVVLVVALVCLCFAVRFVFPVRYMSIIKRESAEFSVEPRLVAAVIWAESKFNPKAVSGAGAVGLMQLLPSTAEFCAKKLGEDFENLDLTDPKLNIRLGVFYLSYLMERFKEHDFKTVVAAYNAGESNVAKWLSDDGVIKFKETRDYVFRVSFAKFIYSFRF